jgi:hypothetical protein
MSVDVRLDMVDDIANVARLRELLEPLEACLRGTYVSAFIDSHKGERTRVGALVLSQNIIKTPKKETILPDSR